MEVNYTGEKNPKAGVVRENAKGEISSVQTWYLSPLGISKKEQEDRQPRWTVSVSAAQTRKQMLLREKTERKQGELLTWRASSFTKPSLSFSSPESALFHISNLQDSREITFTLREQWEKHGMSKVTPFDAEYNHPLQKNDMLQEVFRAQRSWTEIQSLHFRVRTQHTHLAKVGEAPPTEYTVCLPG